MDQDKLKERLLILDEEHFSIDFIDEVIKTEYEPKYGRDFWLITYINQVVGRRRLNENKNL